MRDIPSPRRVMPHRHTVTQLPDDTFASAEGELTSREAEDIAAAAADLLRERAEKPNMRAPASLTKMVRPS